MQIVRPRCALARTHTHNCTVFNLDELETALGHFILDLLATSTMKAASQRAMLDLVQESCVKKCDPSDQ